MKRGTFFEKIKSGKKLKLGGKFISTHRDLEHSSKIPDHWTARLNCILEELADAEKSKPTPAGEIGKLESKISASGIELGKWAGRNEAGDKIAIFAAKLSDSADLFIELPHAHIIHNGELFTAQIESQDILMKLQQAAIATPNKFKGSKIAKGPATGKTEETLVSEGYNYIAGMDEAGRGTWAGPIVGAVVCWSKDIKLPPVSDSKALSDEDRNRLAKEIKEIAPYGIGVVEAEEVDRIGIDAANRKIFELALADMKLKSPAIVAEMIMIDGNPIKPEKINLTAPFKCITQGESSSIAIAAASILAKTSRDHIMIEMAKTHPGYGFEAHKGYGTPQHIKTLKLKGPCQEHRKSFAPIKALLQEQPSLGL